MAFGFPVCCGLESAKWRPPGGWVDVLIVIIQQQSVVKLSFNILVLHNCFRCIFLSFGGLSASHRHLATESTSKGGAGSAIRPNGRPHPRDCAKEQPSNFRGISELAGLSATACQGRLKRLRSEGIIEADVSIGSPKAVGRSIEMFVEASGTPTICRLSDSRRHKLSVIAPGIERSTLS